MNKNLIVSVLLTTMALNADTTETSTYKQQASEKLQQTTQEIKEAYKNDDLISGILDFKYTTIYLNPIEKQVDDTGSGVKVADIQTDSIGIITAGVIILPKTYRIELTYSQSFKGGAKHSEAAVNATDEGVEQIALSLMATDNIEVGYTKYKLNSYMTVFDNEKAILVGTSNTTAKSGNLSDSDTGVHTLYGGENATLAVIKDRFDLKYYFNGKSIFGTKYYTGVYYEKFQKPWCSGFEVWFEVNEGYDHKVAVVYTDSVFTNYGISTGLKKDFKELENGFNLKRLDGSIGLLDIQLTDNYNLSDKMAEQSNQQGYKITLASEIAYKYSFSQKRYGVLSAFVNYDYYSIDLGRTHTSYSPTGQYANNLKGSSLTLSNDYTFGINATLIF